jgi:putative hydrolase of the HAD superfamily
VSGDGAPSHGSIRAVLWDFGGVILSSPFEAFRRYESEHGLPLDFIRSVNAHNPTDNAWAQLERSDVSPAQFDVLFATESEALGHRVPGADVLSLLSGDIRPQMVDTLDAVIASGYLTACLTNNIAHSDATAGHDSGHTGDGHRAEQVRAIMARFNAVIESSKVGVRKPEPRFYEIACATLDVDPHECVFLDDLGINLKPAAAMGMRTIKVIDPDDAIAALWDVLGE